MNIIQVTPNYLPTIGGVQKVVAELSLELARRRHKVTIYTGFDGKSRAPIMTEGPKVEYLKSYYIANTPIIPLLFLKLLNLPYDSLIHVHVAKAFVPEIVYLVSKLRSIPYVVHFHLDVGPTGAAGIFLPLYKNFFLKKVLSSASKIIVFSKRYKKLMKDKYKIEKNVAVIPNGVDKKFFVNRRPNLRKTARLLYVGRISAQKQVHILIESLKFLKSKVVLHIVGDGDLMADMKKLVKKNKQKNVVFHGAKTEDELLDLYKNSDIFLLSSNKEGLPLVLLEAMAAGLPVVASDVIGTHEFVGNSGILVNPPTPKNFAIHIDKLIRSKKLTKDLSYKSRLKAKQYDWEKITKNVEKLYQEINQ